MVVFALWSAPRARSTAFFRSMAERGDLAMLHEPFSGLLNQGETDLDGRVFRSAGALLDWLRDGTAGRDVFLKETSDYRYDDVLADRRFLAEGRHAFLIRRPEEIAASYYALYPEMSPKAIGLEALHELHTAVGETGGHPPVVIDSDDLVARPAATVAAYCAAVGLPFLPEALTWAPSERTEWRRTERWHADAAASSGFDPPRRTYPDNVETSAHLARLAAHHRPFYEKLLTHRLDIP